MRRTGEVGLYFKAIANSARSNSDFRKSFVFPESEFLSGRLSEQARSRDPRVNCSFAVVLRKIAIVLLAARAGLYLNSLFLSVGPVAEEK